MSVLPLGFLRYGCSAQPTSSQGDPGSRPESRCHLQEPHLRRADALLQARPRLLDPPSSSDSAAGGGARLVRSRCRPHIRLCAIFPANLSAVTSTYTLTPLSCLRKFRYSFYCLPLTRSRCVSKGVSGGVSTCLSCFLWPGTSLPFRQFDGEP